MIKVSIIFTVGALFTAINTFGSNDPTFSKVRIKDPNFEKVLKENSHIMEGILDVIEVEGEKIHDFCWHFFPTEDNHSRKDALCIILFAPYG